MDGLQFRGTQAPAAARQEIAPAVSVAAEAAPVETAEVQVMPYAAVPARGVWRAWREKGELPGATVLRVAGLCHSLPDSGGRVLLQESVASEQGSDWGGAGAKSGFLVLERLVVPPALGSEEMGRSSQRVTLPANPAYPWCYPWEAAPENGKPQPLLVTFRKAEMNARPTQATRTPLSTPLSTPHFTHVTILPEGVTVTIRE